MIRIKTADVLDKWLGGSEATLRSLFARARSAAPCVLLLDEIDALATNRASSDSEMSGDVMSRILSTLLNEMDGVSSSNPVSTSQILVIACTNRLEALDAALLRPGRLDEHVELNKLEKVDDVYEVLQFYLAQAPLDPQLDLHSVAEQLVAVAPQSGANIEGLCRMAILRAMRRADRDDDIETVCITSDDFIDHA
jgi:SpoVK/Ycf46/Vps4 family AAA+-type ATPase